MQTLLILLGTIIFGWIGYWIGNHIGIITGYTISTIGSIAGIDIRYKIGKE